MSELGGECDLLPRGHEAQRLRGGSRLHGRLQQGVAPAGPQQQDRRVREERHHQERLTQFIDIIVMMRMGESLKSHLLKTLYKLIQPEISTHKHCHLFSVVGLIMNETYVLFCQ